MTQQKKNRHKAGRAAAMRTDTLKPKKKYASMAMDEDKELKLSKGALKRAQKAAEKASMRKNDEALREAEKKV